MVEEESYNAGGERQAIGMTLFKYCVNSVHYG